MPLRILTLALVAGLTSVACSGTPTGPTPRLPLPPSGSTALPENGIRPIAVIDGWTGAAVANVRVIAPNGGEVVTDGAGRATVTVSCAPATFVATGYLQRRVRCLSATVGAGQPVTLWPVRDELEALETRQFVGAMRSMRATDMPTYLGQDLQTHPDLAAVWQAAAAEVRRLTGGRWLVLVNATADAPRNSDDYYLVTGTPSAAGCDHPWYRTRNRIDVDGFCYGTAAGYFAVELRVAAARLADPDVVLRTLLTASGAGRHALDGLMNDERPAAALSDFERKTLHMVGLRTERSGWPDDELCSTCQ